MLLGSSPKLRALILVPSFLLILFLTAHSFYGTQISQTFSPSVNQPIETRPPCLDLPQVDDVVVILRTGATEIESKLPAHLNTTFRCYSDLIILSDYEETFLGHPVIDVLASVNEKYREESDDFEIYRRLRQQGRSGLRADEVSGPESFEGGKSGKKDNPGWKLDKWKFLPMMRVIRKLRPDKDWYIFIESDTYVVWSNLLQWLRTLNPDKPWYFGSENQIGPDIYAHGGSAFVMSRSAIRAAAEKYDNNEDEWNAWTARHWAGDCVLGKLLLEVGIPLTWSWPMFQGGQPEKMDFAERKGSGNRLWCRPALSYHHFSPMELQRMWEFEQNWIRSRNQQAAKENRQPWQYDGLDILHHRDVFKRFILPNITTEWYEWNNMSPDTITANSNHEACFHLCAQSPECLQFSLGPPGCSISTRQVMLGQRESEYKSYWVMDRIDKWMESMDSCHGMDGWQVT